MSGTPRAVSVIEVAEPAVWAELEALVDLGEHLGEGLGPCRRVVRPSFERDVLPTLKKHGLPVLVRYARRDAAQIQARTHDLGERVAALTGPAQRLLEAAQRHAIDDVVVAAQVWDPEHEHGIVRELIAAELVVPLGQAEEGPGWAMRVHLHPDLPCPPPLTWDFEEAVMPAPDDLEAEHPDRSPLQLLHDLAALAAALMQREVRRTHAGHLAKADARWLGKRLAAPGIAEGAGIEGHPRWGRALRGLELMGAVSMDPVRRTLAIDLGLEAVLAGDTPDALDRLLHRVVDRELHTVLPAVRSALAEAGDGAIDDVVFVDMIREQHRDLLFRPWERAGVPLYPSLGDGTLRRFDDDGFEAVEAPMIRAVVGRLVRLGVLRTAPGVFAATGDGRVWAGAPAGPPPPVWVSSDLEVVVPPGALTPWERLQIERLGKPVSRDVVDKYRLSRDGLMGWLATHELHEALELLARRSPGVPPTVTEALTTWADSAQRVVLTRGVRLGDPEAT